MVAGLRWWGVVINESGSSKPLFMIVAERQRWYWEYVRSLLEPAHLLMVGPAEWYVHKWPDGFAIRAGDMNGYEFAQDALTAIERFSPDIVYVQEEAYSRVAHQLRRVAKRLNCKFVFFAWENINSYDRFPEAVRGLVSNADLVVCGNNDAAKLVHPYNAKTLTQIQVGQNTSIFNISPTEPDYDLIFQGRLVPEKGVDVLKKALEGEKWTILWPEPNFGTPYDQLPNRLRRAKVHVYPSIDQPEWREQHAGYASLEAISCGLWNITSDSAAIVESLSGCPGVLIVPQRQHLPIREGIMVLLEQYHDEGRNIAGREWVEEHYGYQTHASKLLEAFRRLM